MVGVHNTRDGAGYTPAKKGMYWMIFMTFLVTLSNCQSLDGSYFDYYSGFPRYFSFRVHPSQERSDEFPISESLFVPPTSHPQTERQGVVYSPPGFPNPYAQYSEGQWFAGSPSTTRYRKKTIAFTAQPREAVEYDEIVPDIPPHIPKNGNFAVYVKKTIQVSTPRKWTESFGAPSTSAPVHNNSFRRGRNNRQRTFFATTSHDSEAIPSDSPTIDVTTENYKWIPRESHNIPKTEGSLPNVPPYLPQVNASIGAGSQEGSSLNSQLSSPDEKSKIFTDNKSTSNDTILSEIDNFPSEESISKEGKADISSYGRVHSVKTVAKIQYNYTKTYNDESTSERSVRIIDNEKSVFNDTPFNPLSERLNSTSTEFLTTVVPSLNMTTQTNASFGESPFSKRLMESTNRTDFIDGKETPDVIIGSEETPLPESLLTDVLPDIGHEETTPITSELKNKSKIIPPIDGVLDLEAVQDISAENVKVVPSPQAPFDVEENSLGVSIKKETVGEAHNSVNKRIYAPEVKKTERNQPAATNGRIKITAGILAGVFIAVLVFLAIMTGIAVYLFHRWKFGGKSKKLDDRIPSYMPEYSDDCFVANTYLNRHIYLPRQDTSEEITSLDNDSFLNSLEAVTIQNYWTENAKNTKV